MSFTTASAKSCCFAKGRDLCCVDGAYRARLVKGVQPGVDRAKLTKEVDDLLFAEFHLAILRFAYSDVHTSIHGA
jgi:hypothetical protein